MYRSIAYYLARLARTFDCFANILRLTAPNRGLRVGQMKRSPIRSRRVVSSTYEVCEPRQLLAGIVFTAATGEVVIGGTPNADVAQVSQANGRVTVSFEGFETRTFAASEVNSISFVGLGGDDFFENQSTIVSNAFGHGGNDTLIGGSAADRLIGNSGEDTIQGNGGDDFILAGNGDDNVDAGDGNDRVLGIRGANIIEGGLGDDLIFGGLENDVITDISGANTLVGSSGDDSIQGGSDNDIVFGGLGDDIIRGAQGDDSIYAQGGNDFISGGSGEDIVSGNDGDDVLQGAQANDRIIGGAGNDRVNFSGDLLSYDVTGRLGVALIIDDLRGPNFGLVDTVLTVEEYSFSDGVRTADETLNPSLTPRGDGVREVVYVQPIVASNSDGSNEAEFFGTSAQEADIKNRIDEIFAQADIDIEFLPTRQVNDTFINVGNGTGTRDDSDLDRIISNGDRRGLGSSDRNVVDLYFVERVPGFGNVSDNVANGLAFVGASGTAVHVGDDLVNFAEGRATVAAVTAHEIGHNLGLQHTRANNNLLSSGSSGTNLTDSQINTIFNSSISQPITSATLAVVDLPGEVFTQSTLLLPDYVQQFDSTSESGGCGGCGFCPSCTGLAGQWDFQ